MLLGGPSVGNRSGGWTPGTRRFRRGGAYLNSKRFRQTWIDTCFAFTISAPTDVSAADCAIVEYVSGRIRWVFALVLVLFVFGIPPIQDGAPVGGQHVPRLIQGVLMQPWSESIPALLPLAKAALFAVAIIGVLGTQHFAKIVLAYYATILALIAVFQNVATLPEGVTIILGNTVAELTVAVVCFAGLRHTSSTAALRRDRLWLLPLMLLAALCPFALQGETVVAGGWTSVLSNGAGVTYCMVTPVIAGVMALRPTAYSKTTHLAVGWLGTLFGLLNMLTWFVINPASWWMGVLHLPLMVIAPILVITNWPEKHDSSPRRPREGMPTK